MDDGRYENMAKLMIQFDLLTKHVIRSNPMMVNVNATKGTKEYQDDKPEYLDEEIWYLSNQIVCF